jgi:tryptophanyl-tRNA synthetase
VANLILIQASLTGQSVEEAARLASSLNKVELKELVAATLDQHLAPIRAEMRRIVQDAAYLGTHTDTCPLISRPSAGYRRSIGGYLTLQGW